MGHVEDALAAEVSRMRGNPLAYSALYARTRLPQLYAGRVVEASTRQRRELVWNCLRATPSRPGLCLRASLCAAAEDAARALHESGHGVGSEISTVTRMIPALDPAVRLERTGRASGQCTQSVMTIQLESATVNARDAALTGAGPACIAAGRRVTRNAAQWRYGDQDGGAGSEGTVGSVANGWAQVTWANGHTDCYLCSDLSVVAESVVDELTKPAAVATAAAQVAVCEALEAGGVQSLLLPSAGWWGLGCCGRVCVVFICERWTEFEAAEPQPWMLRHSGSADGSNVYRKQWDARATARETSHWIKHTETTEPPKWVQQAASIRADAQRAAQVVSVPEKVSGAPFVDPPAQVFHWEVNEEDRLARKAIKEREDEHRRIEMAVRARAESARRIGEWRQSVRDPPPKGRRLSPARPGSGEDAASEGGGGKADEKEKKDGREQSKDKEKADKKASKKEGKEKAEKKEKKESKKEGKEKTDKKDAKKEGKEAAGKKEAKKEKKR